jgi:hypothetical protein
MCFWNSAGTRITNYAKLHAANLTTKHLATGSWLKPMIRIFKNLRGCLVDKRMLKAGAAPSYYLEGLLYNVPTDKFVDSYADCFVKNLLRPMRYACRPAGKPAFYDKKFPGLYNARRTISRSFGTSNSVITMPRWWSRASTRTYSYT